mmetsp:Transcript_40455/g.46413  ORF Transcript_40455/g.46413 Transcript_40455/m.46413 type:complete len:105 (-) Transcript_40455:17-331(-)
MLMNKLGQLKVVHEQLGAESSSLGLSKIDVDVNVEEQQEYFALLQQRISETMTVITKTGNTQGTGKYATVDHSLTKIIEKLRGKDEELNEALLAIGEDIKAAKT